MKTQGTLFLVLSIQQDQKLVPTNWHIRREFGLSQTSELRRYLIQNLGLSRLLEPPRHITGVVDSWPPNLPTPSSRLHMQHVIVTTTQRDAIFQRAVLPNVLLLLTQGYLDDSDVNMNSAAWNTTTAEVPRRLQDQSGNSQSHVASVSRVTVPRLSRRVHRRRSSQGSSGCSAIRLFFQQSPTTIHKTDS